MKATRRTHGGKNVHGSWFRWVDADELMPYCHWNGTLHHHFGLDKNEGGIAKCISKERKRDILQSWKDESEKKKCWVKRYTRSSECKFAFNFLNSPRTAHIHALHLGIVPEQASESENSHKKWVRSNDDGQKNFVLYKICANKNPFRHFFSLLSFRSTLASCFYLAF